MVEQDSPSPAVVPKSQFQGFRRRRIAVGLATMITVVAVCGGLFAFRGAIWGTELNPTGYEFNSTGYELSRDGQSPYIGNFVVPLEDTSWGETGDDNVLIAKMDGQAVYHPVTSAWYISQMLSSYHESKNPQYLDRAIATAKYLVQGSVTDAKGAVWFPYNFSHDVKTLRLGTPWHSGMAQGMMTSVFVNLYETTGDEHWKNLAAGTVKSFDTAKVERGPWFQNRTVSDGKQFVYYEEYPALSDKQNAHVVNGHIYALYGLYDYYRISGNEHIRWLFDVGASSIRDSFEAYRNPGKPSWYAATDYGRSVWGNPQNYHRGVISQLRTLAQITGDNEFSRQADVLFADFQA